jgi:hypothetical protein
VSDQRLKPAAATCYIYTRYGLWTSGYGPCASWLVACGLWLLVAASGCPLPLQQYPKQGHGNTLSLWSKYHQMGQHSAASGPPAEWIGKELWSNQVSAPQRIADGCSAPQAYRKSRIPLRPPCGPATHRPAAHCFGCWLVLLLELQNFKHQNKTGEMPSRLGRACNRVDRSCRCGYGLHGATRSQRIAAGCWLLGAAGFLEHRASLTLRPRPP